MEASGIEFGVHSAQGGEASKLLDDARRRVMIEVDQTRSPGFEKENIRVGCDTVQS